MWFVERLGSKKRLVFDDAKGADFDGLWMFTFSPSCDRLAYVGARGKKSCVVVGGLESPDYDEIWALAFAGPQSLVFNARDGNDVWRVTMKLD
jgi:hypothetical protein